MRVPKVGQLTTTTCPGRNAFFGHVSTTAKSPSNSVGCMLSPETLTIFSIKDLDKPRYPIHPELKDLKDGDELLVFKAKRDDED